MAGAKLEGAACTAGESRRAAAADTGNALRQAQSIRDVFMDELIRVAKTDGRVVALDADVGESTRTLRFGKAFPGRFFEMGIAEQNTLAVASGLAAVGLIPFTATFAVFTSMRALEMIRTSICYPRRNVKMIGGYAGLSNGKDGATHQSIEDVAVLRGIPNLTILSPSCPAHAKKMVAAVLAHDGPVYIRMEFENLPPIHDDGAPFEIGRAYVAREGADVTLASYGTALHRTLAAAESLAAEGIMAEVLDLPTIKPFDGDALVRSVRKTGALVTVEDHNVFGGLHEAACAAVVAARLPSPVRAKALGVRDVFTESGNTAQLREAYGLDPASIKHAALDVVGARPSVAAS